MIAVRSGVQVTSPRSTATRLPADETPTHEDNAATKLRNRRPSKSNAQSVRRGAGSETEMEPGTAADASRRWAGRFRRLEHRRDEGYSSVSVAVCGAVLVPVDEWVRLLRCAQCFPKAADA
ncbi:hypothetical protein BKA25_002870 [Actinoalloteichus hymeniacidonis]|uniref:Uncharacterized protein n=1 Tax=Actinoalloteichus hymeniacidonis TaxID=340345 RepID=A0AAC9MYL1_9PSEU|nr:hypothetical protein TL08_12955 [Actinoalloteichus hymeniacidonis]MBB5908554.1 hypothetical protein [Actinoalloteichus hymeniacidonis]